MQWSTADTFWKVMGVGHQTRRSCYVSKPRTGAPTTASSSVLQGTRTGLLPTIHATAVRQQHVMSMHTPPKARSSKPPMSAPQIIKEDKPPNRLIASALPRKSRLRYPFCQDQFCRINPDEVESGKISTICTERNLTPSLHMPQKRKGFKARNSIGSTANWCQFVSYSIVSSFKWSGELA